ISVKTGINIWSPGNWYHVMGTYDGITLNIYINGSHEGSRNVISSVFNSYSLLYIGKLAGSSNQGTSGNFQGKIDEVSFDQRVFSPTEISYLYKRGAHKIYFQIRSCDDVACSGESFVGPDGTSSTYFS